METNRVDGVGRPVLRAHRVVRHQHNTQHQEDVRDAVVDFVRQGPASAVLFIVWRKLMPRLRRPPDGQAQRCRYYGPPLPRGHDAIATARRPGRPGSRASWTSSVRQSRMVGIDKADVRYVVHASLAKSLKVIIKAAGRAGRTAVHRSV